MKKWFIVCTMVSIFAQSASSNIFINSEFEKKMREGTLLSKNVGNECEKELNEQFAICRITEMHCKTLDTIKEGKINDAPELQKGFELANKYLAIMEQSEDYQKAYAQFNKYKTNESRSILHEYSYRKLRELIAQESNIQFPSLEKQYVDLKEKGKDFYKANQNINPEKNESYMSALHLVLLHFQQMK